MKYYGKASLASYLKTVMNLLIALGAGVFIFILGRAIINEGINNLDIRKVVTFLLFLAGGISLLAVLYNLRKIIDSLVNVTPFIVENVNSLMNISICCFIVSICYVANFFVNGQYKNFKFIDIDVYGIHTDIEFLIFFFAGCFILILSKVFKQAVEVKEENDFTV
jgi:hypothetical protein